MAHIDVLALTPIAPSRGRTHFDLESRLSRVLKSEIQIIHRLFNKVSDDWKPEDKPSWHTPEPQLSGGNLSAIIETDSIPWVFLDLGTSKRYATMSKGYHPRTHARRFGSTGGGGEPVFVSRKRRRKGVDARLWSDEAAKRRQKPLTKKVQLEVTGYANRQFRADIRAKRIFVIPLFP